ncbi:glutathione S-transferase family protein [Maricaulis parjimensis]|uniref:glutathione S-transferase family protein n=1 Tax=Maricaulis parjimensis TaxID=144023 RepID=UPI00193A8F0A|nr:glutathione S-transferase [Maricaulis parjimensis]
MITVHHLNNSRSQRVLWLLEEIGCDYTIEKYMRDSETMRAPASLKAVHPLGKSPVVTDGDVTVAESGAIMEYLVDTYAPGLKPEAGTAAHRAYVYWMHFAEGSAMPPMLIRLLVDQIGKAKMPFFAKPIAKQIVARLRAFVDPEIDNIFRYIEDVLGQSEWLAGDAFTAADMQMSFPLEAAAARAGLDKTAYPNIHAWLDRIHARPAYAKALEKGGEYGIVGS